MSNGNGYRIVFAGAVEVHSETGAVLRRAQGDEEVKSDPSLTSGDTGGAEVPGDSGKDKGDPTDDAGKAPSTDPKTAATKAETSKAAATKAEAPKE